MARRANEMGASLDKKSDGRVTRAVEKAMGEVGASVSEDMSSLRSIRKFDEQYGERKGRRKRNPFGLGAVKEREEDARVRA